MCGLTGFIDSRTNRNETALQHIVQDMTDMLVHRGPDSDGIWTDAANGVALGHRRLAIIDLSVEGHQPMISTGGRYIIVYNGEIYNFLSLKERLVAKGCKFRGTSDTEVLLTAIEEWGLEKSLKEINGMFAFALWDRKENILHLARDRMGKKPLYYGWAGKSFLFASELKAFHKHPDFVPRVNRDALAVYCRHNYVPAPWSIFEGVFKLSPASFLSVPFSGGKTVTPETVLHDQENCYWDLKTIAEEGCRNPLAVSEQDALKQLDEVLTESVEQRMISDVPLGAFLSGGIDSSLIVALMQKQSTQPIKTFSIGFEEAGYNEVEHAAKIAAHLGTDHTEFYVTADEARESIPALPEMYDEPFADSSQIPTFHVARLAKQHVTVALSGDGGDEGFAGYNRYRKADRFAKFFLKAPYGIRKPAGSLLAGLFPDGQIHKAALVLQTKDPQQFYRIMMSYAQQPEQLVIGGHEPVVPMTDIKGISFINHMMYTDMCAYLPDDILVKIDRASMAVSLETRVPFLDYKVIEYAWTLPLHMKIQHGEGKKILRSLLGRYVPEHLFDRPKQGFAIPLGEWLRDPLREWAESLLDETRLKEEGFFNVETVRKLWQQHLGGKDKSYPLWGILMFQSWYGKWFSI